MFLTKMYVSMIRKYHKVTKGSSVPFETCKLHLMFTLHVWKVLLIQTKILSEYDQEIPQSPTAEKPVTS